MAMVHTFGDLKYGLVKGGFAVVNDRERKASFAYRTSPNWSRAMRYNNVELRTLAAMMLKDEHQCTMPRDIVERHYQAVRGDLYGG